MKDFRFGRFIILFNKGSNEKGVAWYSVHFGIKQKPKKNRE